MMTAESVSSKRLVTKINVDFISFLQPRKEMKSRCPGKAMQKKESLQSGMSLAWIGRA